MPSLRLQEIPAAVRICDKCGELTAGKVCLSCTETRAQATSMACWLIRTGVSTTGIQRTEEETPIRHLFCDLLESEFHRLRLASLNAMLPSRLGLQATTSHEPPSAVDMAAVCLFIAGLLLLAVLV